MVTLAIVDDFGEIRDLDHGLVTGSSAREIWTIDPEEPLSAHGETHWSQSLVARRLVGLDRNLHAHDIGRGVLSPEGKHRAYEGGELVFERLFDESVPRGFL